jgi:hypothetical protein
MCSAVRGQTSRAAQKEGRCGPMGARNEGDIAEGRGAGCPSTTGVHVEVVVPIVSFFPSRADWFPMFDLVVALVPTHQVKLMTTTRS